MAVVVIRDADQDDLTAVTEIANALIATTAIEWTDEPHTVEDRAVWLGEHRAAGHPVVVAEVDGEVVGFAAWGEFRDIRRWPGYRTTVEHTIHVRGDHWGAGVGRALMAELVQRGRAAGVHVMVGAVDGGNLESIRFHERLGFVEVARLSEVGHKFGRWLDLVLLELILDDHDPPRD